MGLIHIAEGAGRLSAAEAARHYTFARGSAMECAAIFDAFRILGAVDDEPYARAIELIGRLVAMLTKLA